MSDFALDPVTRGLVVKKGSFLAISGPEKVAQAIGIRLRCWLGEWFLDVTHGVPYLEQVLGKAPRPEMVEAVLRAQILDVAGVLGIEAFTLLIDPRTRIAKVDFVVRTAAGPARGAVTTTPEAASASTSPVALDDVLLDVTTLA